MVSRYIEYVTNWKKTRLSIHKFSLFDIFFYYRRVTTEP